MKPAVLYPFAGDTITAADLARHITVHRVEQITLALRAGCTSVREVMMWLAQREYEAGQRHRRGSHLGMSAQRRKRAAETERARAGR